MYVVKAAETTFVKKFVRKNVDEIDTTRIWTSLTWLNFVTVVWFKAQARFSTAPAALSQI